MSEQMSMMSPEDNLTFSVVLGSVTHTVESRSEAVNLAKELSKESHQRVSVERSDGRVQMQFTSGTLDSFNCETRGFRSE